MKNAEINQIAHVGWALAHAVFFLLAPGIVGDCHSCQSTESMKNVIARSEAMRQSQLRYSIFIQRHSERNEVKRRISIVPIPAESHGWQPQAQLGDGLLSVS